MSILEIAIIAVIALAVILALRRIVKMRRSGCSCGCSGCCAECGGACGMTRRREEGLKLVDNMSAVFSVRFKKRTSVQMSFFC